MRMGARPDEQLLRAQFDKYDANDDGEIDADELANLLTAVLSEQHQQQQQQQQPSDEHDGGAAAAARPSDDEVAEMLAEADTDASGTIGFDEFVMIHRKARAGELRFAALREVMCHFDELIDTLPVGVGFPGMFDKNGNRLDPDS